MCSAGDLTGDLEPLGVGGESAELVLGRERGWAHQVELVVGQRVEQRRGVGAEDELRYTPLSQVA